MRILSLLLMLSMVIAVGCKEPAPPGAANDAEPGELEMERVKAQAGVGKQGQIIGKKEGVLRTPVKALFTVKQRLMFLKVEHALNLYEGEHGFKPKTEEEFMAKIIEFNKIDLPELPAGQKYVWDPESAELLVEKPKS